MRLSLAALYQFDRAAFAVAAKLVKEKLGIGRRDLEASLKSLYSMTMDRTTESRFP